MVELTLGVVATLMTDETVSSSGDIPARLSEKCCNPVKLTVPLPSCRQQL